ncbi:hypothetical protein STEG23_034572, partial [Scotinomys teguina]
MKAEKFVLQKKSPASSPSETAKDNRSVKQTNTHADTVNEPCMELVKVLPFCRLERL